MYWKNKMNRSKNIILKILPTGNKNKLNYFLIEHFNIMVEIHYKVLFDIKLIKIYESRS